eukprot:2333583-Pleurochrysis_carterae.AAC.3
MIRSVSFWRYCITIPVLVEAVISSYSVYKACRLQSDGEVSIVDRRVLKLATSNAKSEDNFLAPLRIREWSLQSMATHEMCSL